MVHTRHSFELDSPVADYISLQTRSGNKANDEDREDDLSDESSEIAMSTRRTSHSRGRGNDQGERRQRRAVIDDEISTDEEEVPFRRTRRKISPRELYEEQTTTRRSSREKKLMYDTYNQHLLDKAILCSMKENQRDHDRNTHLTRSRGQAEPRRTRAATSTKGHDNEADAHIRKSADTELVEQNDEDDDEYSDMYSRVKRKRIHLKKDMYGIPIQEEESGSGSENDTDATESSSDGDEDEEEEEQPSRSYYLREHKPLTQRFEVPIIEKKRSSQMMFRESPPRTRSSRTEKHITYRSPAHRTTSFKRRAAFHGSSSTSSSDSSDDEKRFEKRKAKSMVKARNRCLPMNFTPSDVTSGVINDRTKIGSSLADVDPMSIDRSITFDSVGGLGKHIRSLKEMVVFPLLYPEVFERFKISPPRGVLFYGPPGTGKTLVARALANECSTGEKRVAFFMRKGADCLSKWVGESERQLRLLFDQAYQMRPAIIFFDEIDGLAPVRSSRQDQIHSSIVSTLLALMDGLDSRGEIVIIGATNRIDSIDPALRRPGRFDREFLFPLPSLQARQQILKIHTNSWNPKLSSAFVDEVAGKCVGYCGADLKALCTEAALLALRRRYPQIYTSTEKLQLDVTSILMCAKDFHKAMQIIVPSSQRAVTSPARALAVSVHPLLRKQFGSILDSLQVIFPSVLSQLSNLDAPATSSQSKNTEGCMELDKVTDDLCSDEDEDSACIFEQGRGRNHRRSKEPQGPFLNFSSAFSHHPSTHRPRLLLAGEHGQGQSSHLGPAVLHHVEQLPVHVLDLPALFAVAAKTPEESCAQIFREAKRTSPSVIYMPHIHQWWDVLSDTLRATFTAMIYDLEPSAPILLLATSEEPYDQLDAPVQELFDIFSGEVVQMKNPNEDERRAYFENVLLVQTAKPPSKKRQSAIHALEVLPKAPPPEPRKLTENELKKLRDQEEATLRELRLFLRDLLNKLGKDRKFGIFTKPVDVDDVSDYYEIIANPMDLATMMSKIDLHQYHTVEEFTHDIELIASNALEYNPDRDPSDRAIRHRACALKDTTRSILQAELDPDFEKLCVEITESRIRRGEVNTKSVPNYYFTKPIPTKPTQEQPSENSPDAHSRFSRRVRQLSIETRQELEDIERGWKNDKAVAKRLSSPQKDDAETPPTGDKNSVKRDVVNEIRNLTTPQIKQQYDAHANTSTKKSSKKRKCIWDSTRRRKKKPIISMHSQHKKALPSAVVNGYLSHSENNDDDSTPHKVEMPKHHFARSLHIDVNVRGSVSGNSPRSPIQGSKSPSGRTRSPQGGSSSRQANTQAHSPPPSHRTARIRSPQCIDDNTDGSVSDIRNTTDKLGSVSDIRNTIGGVDSGVGSSIESNGDSLDSVDQVKEQEKERLGILNENDSPEASASAKNNQECTSEEKAESPALRMTRSKTHSKQVQRAIDILDEPPQPLILDRTRISLLLDIVVGSTEGYNIEKLEKLHSLLGRAVFSYRYDFDKTCLVQDLEATIHTFTRRHPRTSTHIGDGGMSFTPSTATSAVGYKPSTAAPSGSWQTSHDFTSRS